MPAYILYEFYLFVIISVPNNKLAKVILSLNELFSIDGFKRDIQFIGFIKAEIITFSQ